MFEPSITGITWLVAAFSSFIFAFRLVFRRREVEDVLKYFALGFSMAGVAFLFFAVPLLTTNPVSISKAHFMGHVFLYLGLIFMAYIPQKLNEKSFGKLSKLLAPVVILFGGFLQLYLEASSSLTPEILHVASFSFVKWNLDFGSVFLFLLILWGVCLTTAMSLVRNAKSLSRKGRISWVTFAIALTLATTGGTLSSVALQPPSMVLIETLVAFFGFLLVLLVALFMLPEEGLELKEKAGE